MSATLYYTPTSCGAASFISQNIAGLKIDTVEADISTHKIKKTGADFYAVNPKGNVPALTLPGGVLLNEGAAVLQWIADQAPQSKLAPANGSTERYQLINTLNYIATEVHGSGYGPIFKAQSDAEKEAARKALAKKLQYLNDNILKDGKFTGGSDLTIADIYLWICFSWSGYTGVDLSPYKNIASFQAAVQAEPRFAKAQEALKAASA